MALFYLLWFHDEKDELDSGWFNDLYASDSNCAAS
jgi:hypothetical protein